MKRGTLITVIALVAVLAVLGVVVFGNKKSSKETTTNTTTPTPTSSVTNPQEVQNTGDQANSVTIANFAFGPKQLTVKKGTKVTWTNQDSTEHSITPDTNSPDFIGSDLLAKGKSYSFTFNTTGTYAYHCSLHSNMQGTITVTP